MTIKRKSKKAGTKKQKRAEKGLKNAKKSKDKFPVIAKKVVSQSDIIIEILDARFIEETRNKYVEDKIRKRGKKLIYVLNKTDIAQDIKAKLKEVPDPKITISCKERQGSRKLRDLIKRFSKDIEKPRDKFGRITVGIIGQPNTGKSSIINILTGKSSAKTGSQAGFTKGMQKIKMTKNILLMDTPGVIPYKNYSNNPNDRQRFIDQQAKIGARTEEKIRDPESFVDLVIKKYPGILEGYYKVDSEGDSEILMEKIERSKSILKKGNLVDTDKVARLILMNWQKGNIKI